MGERTSTLATRRLGRGVVALVACLARVGNALLQGFHRAHHCERARRREHGEARERRAEQIEELALLVGVGGRRVA
jgi:hypothetical protein